MSPIHKNCEIEYIEALKKVKEVFRRSGKLTNDYSIPLTNDQSLEIRELLFDLSDMIHEEKWNWFESNVCFR